MPAFFRDSRQPRRRQPAWHAVVAGLLLALAACEGFPGFGSQSAPIVIEVPVTQTAPAAESEPPRPPLPERKPLAALQARRSPGTNGSDAHDASHGAPPEEPAGHGGEYHAEPPPTVTGLNRADLIDRFGTPVAEREAAPARVLEFAEGDCVLSAYLYFDTARNDFYVLQYQVNGMTDRNEAADRCLMRIRDAARR